MFDPQRRGRAWCCYPKPAGSGAKAKVRPIPGNSPHDRPVSRVSFSSPRRVCDDPFPATFLLPPPNMRFLKAWRNLSGPMRFSKQNQTLGWEPTASRWSAPSPGKRTRREDHALSHRPQMSSDRLFLDRVARQHCPTPLHRHTQINTHSAEAKEKGTSLFCPEGDISTLP